MYYNIFKLLNQGKNLLIYPEGVWNVTSNLLMLPLFPGIIEMAKETGCDIVPVAIERYDKELIRLGNQILTTATWRKSDADSYGV